MAPETLTATQAAALFRPVDSFAVGLGPANPQALLVALSERDDFEDLTLGGALILGLYDLMGKPGVHYRCGFFGPAERFYKAAGADIQLVPAGFRQFAPVLEEYAPRIMAVQATPPDAEGTCSLSLHYGATRRELLRAGHDPNRLLIVEVNPNLPRTSALEGFDNTISTDIIDVIVECDLPPVVLPDSNPAPQDEAIAEFALSLIPDRATLQTGIGGIPSIVAAKLAQREGGGYGVHSEMFTDGLMQLHLAGKVTNEHKGQFPGVSVTTFALGSAELYAWLDRNPQVAFAPVSLVNDPSVIAKNDRFISINGAITVDLFGQVVARTSSPAPSSAWRTARSSACTRRSRWMARCAAASSPACPSDRSSRPRGTTPARSSPSSGPSSCAASRSASARSSSRPSRIRTSATTSWRRQIGSTASAAPGVASAWGKLVP
jgi:acyl-CoA hydrolase